MIVPEQLMFVTDINLILMISQTIVERILFDCIASLDGWIAEHPACRSL